MGYTFRRGLAYAEPNSKDIWLNIVVLNVGVLFASIGLRGFYDMLDGEKRGVIMCL